MRRKAEWPRHLQTASQFIRAAARRDAMSRQFLISLPYAHSFLRQVCAALILACAFAADSAQAQTECPEGQTRLTKVIGVGVADDTGCVADDAAENSAGCEGKGGPYSHSRFDDRFNFAIGVRRGNGRCRVLCEVGDASFPAKIEQALADNGSEFCGAFDRCLQEQGIRHCHTYPKCPKMNALKERFNRALQEESAEFEEGLLRTDIREFNNRRIKYLLWFNTQRPHYGLELQASMTPTIFAQVSNMSWHPAPN